MVINVYAADRGSLICGLVCRNATSVVSDDDMVRPVLGHDAVLRLIRVVLYDYPSSW